MNLKKFATISMLLIAMGLAGGCHYKSSDSYRYGRGYERSDNYREGYRDGRTAERRRDNWRDSRWDDRRDGWWRR